MLGQVVNPRVVCGKVGCMITLIPTPSNTYYLQMLSFLKPISLAFVSISPKIPFFKVTDHLHMAKSNAQTSVLLLLNQKHLTLLGLLSTLNMSIPAFSLIYFPHWNYRTPLVLVPLYRSPLELQTSISNHLPQCHSSFFLLCSVFPHSISSPDMQTYLLCCLSSSIKYKLYKIKNLCPLFPL